jgi:hypothetical protein
LARLSAALDVQNGVLRGCCWRGPAKRNFLRNRSKEELIDVSTRRAAPIRHAADERVASTTAKARPLLRGPLSQGKQGAAGLSGSEDARAEPAVCGECSCRGESSCIGPKGGRMTDSGAKSYLPENRASELARTGPGDPA